MLEPTLLETSRAGENPWASISGNHGWFVLPRKRGKQTKIFKRFLLQKKTILKRILKLEHETLNVTVRRAAKDGLITHIYTSHTTRVSKHRAPTTKYILNLNLQTAPKLEHSNQFSSPPLNSKQMITNIGPTLPYMLTRSNAKTPMHLTQ